MIPPQFFKQHHHCSTQTYSQIARTVPAHPASVIQSLIFYITPNSLCEGLLGCLAYPYRTYQYISRMWVWMSVHSLVFTSSFLQHESFCNMSRLVPDNANWCLHHAMKLPPSYTLRSTHKQTRRHSKTKNKTTLSLSVSVSVSISLSFSYSRSLSISISISHSLARALLSSIYVSISISITLSIHFLSPAFLVIAFAISYKFVTRLRLQPDWFTLSLALRGRFSFFIYYTHWQTIFPPSIFPLSLSLYSGPFFFVNLKNTNHISSHPIRWTLKKMTSQMWAWVCPYIL